MSGDGADDLGEIVFDEQFSETTGDAHFQIGKLKVSGNGFVYELNAAKRLSLSRKSKLPGLPRGNRSRQFDSAAVAARSVIDKTPAIDAAGENVDQRHSVGCYRFPVGAQRDKVDQQVAWCAADL